MFRSKLFDSKVNQAALGSLLAMIAFVVMSTQMAVSPAAAQVAVAPTAEVA